jgi:AAA+ ATPase superfamily predicted ATPase
MASAYEEVVRRALPHLHKTGKVKRLGRCGRYWERDVEVDIVCIKEGHITAVEVKWSNLNEGEVDAVIRDMRRKLSREGDYYVAVREGPKNPHVITVEDIFEKPRDLEKNTS